MGKLSYEEQALAFRFAHLPLPDGVTSCDPWLAHGQDDWRRLFVIREWEIAGLWVSVAGEQDHHGNVTRWLHVGGDDQCRSSDRQRLILALVEAGRLLDSLIRADTVSTVQNRV
jgi:hypothetical protein